MDNLNRKLYFDTDVWKPMPMVDKETLDMGLEGGEGTQWQLFIEFDPIEGKYAFMGTDVGGLYKSSDSGKTWTPATIGYTPCGSTGTTFDPNNINRVITVGANSYAHEQNGLYISEDCGETWKGVLPVRIAAYRDFRHQVAFDKSSCDEKIGGSRIVYWSRESFQGYNRDSDIHPALYRSVDGGYTWEEIPNSEKFGQSVIAVHPENGNLYLANEHGLFISTDKAKTFTKIFDGEITAFDTVLSQPDSLFLTKRDGLYLSDDAGKSFRLVKGKNFPEHLPRYLRVSPANTKHMLLQDDRMDTPISDQTKIFYSHDGGESWELCSRGNETNYRHVPGSWIPFCIRQCNFTWHPKDENVAMTFGGDFIMRSTDGGKSFQWSNSGYNGIMTGGWFSLNVNHPDWFFNPSQDYNGGYTLDGGKTWKYIQWLADWGGFCYGGYVLSPEVVVVGLTDHFMYGRGYQVCTTFDGGETIIQTGCKIEGNQVGMGMPGDENIVFMAEWRSQDGAKSFEKMENCTGVFTYDKTDKTLFGASKNSVVKSVDAGKTWQTIATLDTDRIYDLSFDHVRKLVYVAAPNGVFTIGANDGEITQLGNFSKDSQGNFPQWTVGVDPINTDIVYVGCRIGLYETDVAVVRSLDAGKTWTNLTRQPGDGRKGPDGAREASCLRVHPITREIIVGTCCRGVWSMSCPEV